MEISSNAKGVAGRLSNFTPRPFIFDDIECASMEGLLQSFKFKSVDMQKEVCKLVGRKAKKKGSKKNWKTKQILYWKGVEYKRKSKEYALLIERAYDALSSNPKFIKDILKTGNSTFKHSLGSNKKANTVLTESEFCRQLYRLRNKLNKK